MQSEDGVSIVQVVFGFGITGTCTGVPAWTTANGFNAINVFSAGPGSTVSIEFDGDLTGDSVIVPGGGTEVISDTGQELCGDTYPVLPPG